MDLKRGSRFKEVCMAFLSVGAIVLVSAAETHEFVSQARWLWSEPADNPPTNAFVRLTFDVDAPVKSAWFYRFADRRCTDFVNGRRVELRLWPELRDKYR